MSYSVKQGNIFGRLGTGIGKGLSEQIPKEIERHRISQGLKELNSQKNLSPQEYFTGALSVPGLIDRPQVVQSLSQLAKQQSYLNSLKNQYEGKEGAKSGQKGYVPTQEELTQPVKGEVPSLATPESTAQSYKSYIPPTEQQERTDAYENFQKNPARYDYDFDNALRERKAITARNQEIQKAHQTQEATAVAKEEGIKKALADEVTKLKLENIPPKAYQNFEEKVLNAVLSEKEGGEGITQEQAIKKYSKELDQANRDYLKLGALSPWSPRDFNRETNALQKNFSSRGEQQLMMDQLISDYQVSPLYAAHKSYPIKKGELPTLNKFGIQVGTPTISGTSIPRVNDATYSKLKKEMGKTHSPLSIAYELEQKGQDPRGWLNYLDNHRDNLEVWQADQLAANLNVFDLKDVWLRAWE